MTVITSTHISLATESDIHVDRPNFLWKGKSYHVCGRQRTRSIWRPAPTTGLVAGREYTDGMSKCLVHSRSQPHASSLQRNVRILWSTSLPAPLFFLSEETPPSEIVKPRDSEGKETGQHSSNCGELLCGWQVRTCIVCPEHIATAAAALVFSICMALTVCQYCLKYFTMYSILTTAIWDGCYQYFLFKDEKTEVKGKVTPLRSMDIKDLSRDTNTTHLPQRMLRLDAIRCYWITTGATE